MVSGKQVRPFFSVITCTRNSERYLSTCLSSVKSQSFRDFEHIVIDGHSSDGTVALLKRAGIAPVRSKPKGIAAAMNVGIKRAKGKYIFFLHSDDSFYDSQVLSHVHAYLTTHAHLDWVFGRIHEVTGEGKTVGFPPRRRIFQGRHPSLLKFYNYIPHQAVFMKKEVFDHFGQFDESLRSMMDDELWLRIAPHTAWEYMPVIVANYSVRTDSQSESKDNKKANDREYEQVQSRYLNGIELFFAQVINKILR